MRFCQRIVSGGQTGADRAALDFAIEYGYPHGGWAPRGREAEDGPISLIYRLTEMPNGGYRQRTKRNVEDSHGTLIVNIGLLDGGTLATQVFAQKLSRPCFVAQLDKDSLQCIAARSIDWLQARGIATLNVAGPRESKRPGIYRLTREFLEAVDTLNHRVFKTSTNGSMR
ncbi:putative molybdenum carrier protein [Bordetella hinzii]|uniref:putative molybdenum carrier protein n=1 Tax=Bordetella hinzii TaxID=103855 RepID=UPI00068B1E58|nr:putative molybdenum carrier protein [Bordetella hinzii]